MSAGLIGYASAGDSNQPSPSIWGDCPNTLLRDKGLGFFAHEDFFGNIEVASFADKSVFGQGFLGMDGDTGVLAPKTGELGGYATITTGASDNDAIAVYSSPLGPIVRNSGNKLWFEARLEFPTLYDGAVFVGLTTEANATRDVVADNPSTSAVAGLTAASVIGFRTAQVASAIASFAAVYAKSAGTPVVVLADVTNSTQLTAAGGTAAALAATTELKLGIYFNGRHTISFYVNGYKVASQDVDSTIDQSGNMVAVVNVKTGTANAKGLTLDWVRYGFLART